MDSQDLTHRCINTIRALRYNYGIPNCILCTIA